MKALLAGARAVKAPPVQHLALAGVMMVVSLSIVDSADSYFTLPYAVAATAALPYHRRIGWHLTGGPSSMATLPLLFALFAAQLTAATGTSHSGGAEDAPLVLEAGEDRCRGSSFVKHRMYGFRTTCLDREEAIVWSQQHRQRPRGKMPETVISVIFL